MAKVLTGSRTLLYPTPVVLVGANVDSKTNFMAAAWCGIANKVHILKKTEVPGLE